MRTAARACLLAPLSALALALPLQAAPLTLHLRSEVLLPGPRIVLSELVEIEAEQPRLRQALADLPMGRAPLVGQVARRSRGELETMVRSQALSAGLRIEWSGARSVDIRTAGQTIGAARLTALAAEYLRQRFGADYAALELLPAGVLPDLAAPAGGRLELKVRPLEGLQLRPRTVVWVDVLQDGVVYRSAAVALEVSARRRVWVAEQDLAAGSMLRQGDFRERELELAGLPAQPAAQDVLQRGGRLRTALRKGEVLERQSLAAPGLVLRGDRVALVATGQGIRVETQAYALGDAAPGQALKVMPEQSREAVQARVLEAGLVIVDGK
ncbi:flagellar basal body P-ring formation chaperone FlgA [Massilia sp. BJB1822]|uniref:flagellar basal body P-ring formation chaperone FlgA n=1 Tax=Massilia sp. BJB1822 TaxID=2744470 RepID=UPI001594BAC7|nr:flagellar basal body P-ring formation chaperone FlgA [Massilia sp. BJB1822]NVE01294.1 flagellar basal body P-ring formation protein FlgA [Massilia sp. BJB1822]